MKKLILFLFVAIRLNSQIASQWQFTGPSLFPTNASGQINGIGRCTQLKFDPSAPNKLYTTSASGGVWYSNDTGATWQNLNSDYLPDMQCASICIDHTNNANLYLGTGDPNYYSTGLGVWKSTNGGLNWVQSNTGMGNRLVVEMIMKPNNNQTLLAATENGIYRTTNAGANWSVVKTGGDFKAMVLKPNSLDTVYAVTSSQVWRTLDFGTTWQQITNGVFVPNGNGLGMRLAVSKANPNTVYVSMIANEGLTLKSTNFGTSFSIVYNNSSQSLVGYDATTPGQGDYNFSLNSDPSNANIIYVAAHCVWKSLNAGATWSKLTSWAIGCHTDMHGIVVHPNYSNMLYNVNDGGIFISRDGGNTWKARSDGIGATENYSAAQSNSNRQTVSIGTQDNGELYLNNQTWFTNRGGDWTSKMQFDYLTPSKVYYSENGNRRFVNNSETSLNLPFTANNQVRFAFNKKVVNTGFVSLQNIYRSNNLNLNSPSWSQIYSTTSTVKSIHSSIADSTILYAITSDGKIHRSDNALATTPTFTNYTTPAATNVYASIATSKTNSNVVYISCGNTVYKSTNKGQTFTSYNTGITGGLNILQLQPYSNNLNDGVFAATAYAVYYRDNTMASWQNITYNLPSISTIEELMIYNTNDALAVLRVAMWGRGVWELPLNTTSVPVVNFYSDKQTICPGSSVQFTDASYQNITNWQWSFPGATPAISNLQNPIVSYNSSGIFPVTLVATSASGTSSLTQNTYINVVNNGVLPIAEGFTATSFPPADWQNIDVANDNVVWLKSNTIGGFGNSTNSTFFDNYNYDVNGKFDALLTQPVNLISVSNPKLYYDVAYARYDNVNYDTLAVCISTNCGQTYTVIATKGGTALATAPDNIGFFNPSSAQWRTDTVYLAPFIGLSNAVIMFQNRGNYGNNLYLDNINLGGNILTTETTKNNTDKNLFQVSIFPNPSNGIFTINSLNQQTINEVKIYNQLGKLVFEKNKINSFSTDIDFVHLTKGMYFCTVISENKSVTKKIILN